MGKSSSKPYSPSNHFSALVQRGDIPGLVEFLDKRPYFKEKPVNDNLWSPLMLACVCEQSEVVRFLIEECKVDVNHEDLDGETCLHKCAWSGSRTATDIAEYLCLKGANVSKKSTAGVTPKGIAFIRNSSCEKMLSYYEKHGPWAKHPWHDWKKLLWLHPKTKYNSLPKSIVKEICNFM